MLTNAWTPVKVILVQQEFDELNIDITKSLSKSSNYSFVKITHRTVYLHAVVDLIINTKM